MYKLKMLKIQGLCQKLLFVKCVVRLCKLVLKKSLKTILLRLMLMLNMLIYC